jgi:hypothetical protein
MINAPSAAGRREIGLYDSAYKNSRGRERSIEVQSAAMAAQELELEHHENGL